MHELHSDVLAGDRRGTNGTFLSARAQGLRGRAASDRGVTLVEVMVAMVILAVVGAALAAAVNSSSRSVSRAQVRTAQAAVVESVQDEVRLNQAWMQDRECRAAAAIPPGCELSPEIYDPTNRARGANGVQFQVTAVVLGVDKELDGVGNADSDGEEFDYYRLTLNVRQRIGGGETPFVAPQAITTSILPETRLATGKLRFAACVINAYTNEGVNLGDKCGGEPSWVELADGSRLELSPSINQTVTLVPLDDVIGGSRTSITTDGKGSATASLAPGTYQLSLNPPVGFEIWTAQTKPERGVVRVAANRSVNARIALRPVPPPPPPPPPPDTTGSGTGTGTGAGTGTGTGTTVVITPPPPPPPTRYPGGGGGP